MTPLSEVTSRVGSNTLTSHSMPSNHGRIGGLVMCISIIDN